MKFKTLSMVLGVGLAIPAFAVEIPKSITSSDCLACHALNKKVVGPSFLEIANKYRGRSTAALVKKIKKGSATHTPHKYTKASQIKESIQWILKLKEADLLVSTKDHAPNPAKRAQKIIKGSDCLACHKPEGKLVGPGFDQIRAKYSDTDVPTLVKKVKAGGSGNWGDLPMTPHPTMKDADIEAVVKWILNPKAAPSSAKVSAKKAASAVGVDKAAALKVMKGSDCLVCHQEKVKIVGPAFIEIAKKYQGQASVVDSLVKKVKAGGSGVWGPIPMAPHPTVKDKDIRIAVEYILSIK